jgi:hypothetical protein
MLPLIVSLVWVVSDIPGVVVLNDAGRYGMGLPITLSGCDAAPLRLMIRPSVNPVVPAATGVFTHSLVKLHPGERLEAHAGTPVAPALSPCQPLLTSYIAQVALRDIDDDPAAAVRDVMPQDAADVVVVHGFDDREAGHVLHHRSRRSPGSRWDLRRQVEIGDDALFEAPRTDRERRARQTRDRLIV